MSAGYWLTVLLGVASMLASPIIYRVLHKHKNDMVKLRWRLCLGLCAVLFLLGLGLLLVMGLRYPKLNPIVSEPWARNSPFRETRL